MTNPLRAGFYADELVHRTVRVESNVTLAKHTVQLRFHCPELARKIVPGQFVMLRLSGYDDPLIGRPLALFETHDERATPTSVSVVYLVKGKLTTRLAQLQTGQNVDVWGPLGNGFSNEPIEHLIMVAGGIGQTPFLALANEFLGRREYGTPSRRVTPSRKVTLCYGARSADYLAGIDDFERAGVEVRIATEDGTAGHHGLVTDILDQVLQETELPHRVACCGPEPMMEAVSQLTRDRDCRCQVSLETPMACGVGICFTCVAKVKCNGEWDYKRTCVEGPVFESSQIVWD